MYSKKVLEYFQNPKNAGKLKDANAIGHAKNESDGDEIILYLKIKDDIIQEATFEAYGCAAAIASASMTTELIKGKSIDYALKLKNKDVSDALDGLPKNKIKCSVLSEEIIKKAIDYYRNKNG